MQLTLVVTMDSAGSRPVHGHHHNAAKAQLRHAAVAPQWRAPTVCPYIPEDAVVVKRVASIVSLALALALTACAGDAAQGSASPFATDSPSPESTSTPTPTATPIDVAGVFAAQMQASEQLEAELSGTIEAGERVGELSGTMEAVGSDVHQIIVVAFPELPPHDTETIVVGSFSYALEDGIWIRTAHEPEGEEPAGIQAIVDAALEDPDGLALAGTELVQGDRLHRLEIEPAPEISAGMLGFADPTIADFEATLAFLAEEGGTPAGMVVEATWIQGEQPVPVAIEMRFRFDWEADDLQITAPEDPWEWYDSDPLGYRMAHPVGWTVTHERAAGETPAIDRYLGPVDDQVSVVLFADLQGEPSAEDWFRESAQLLLRDFGVEPDVANEVVLANGFRVRILTLHYEEGGDQFFFQQAVVFGGTVAWDVNWFSFEGNEVEDGETLLKLLTSFEPAG
ncbi:MAG: hypothetical protein LC798_08095 [Chloroflexi bacterium]|nr:hypothetical protein [Chloroflexota bacterium]